MSGTRAIGMIAVVAAIITACEMEADTEDAFPGAETATEEPALTPGPVGGMDAPAAMIRVDSLPGEGAYVTDAAGRALYLLESEPAETSACYDDCAEEWPPFLAAEGAPEGNEPVRADLIGTIERRDGNTQVTYAGHPLYYYHDDEGPGDTAGQDVTDDWGEWYLVTPSGEPLEDGASGEEETDGG